MACEARTVIRLSGAGSQVTLHGEHTASIYCDQGVFGKKKPGFVPGFFVFGKLVSTIVYKNYDSLTNHTTTYNNYLIRINLFKSSLLLKISAVVSLLIPGFPMAFCKFGFALSAVGLVRISRSIIFNSKRRLIGSPWL